MVAAGDVTPPPDPPPSRVSMSSPSPYSRRRCALASRFREPTAPRRHAWVSLQGRLVDAEEASSAATPAPGLPPDEAVAWELFSPLHRVLLVATVAAASSRSHAARRIEQLQRSIDLRVCVCRSPRSCLGWISFLRIVLAGYLVITLNVFMYRMRCCRACSRSWMICLTR